MTTIQHRPKLRHFSYIPDIIPIKSVHLFLNGKLILDSRHVGADSIAVFNPNSKLEDLSRTLQLLQRDRIISSPFVKSFSLKLHLAEYSLGETFCSQDYIAFSFFVKCYHFPFCISDRCDRFFNNMTTRYIEHWMTRRKQACMIYEAFDHYPSSRVSIRHRLGFPTTLIESMALRVWILQ